MCIRDRKEGGRRTCARPEAGEDRQTGGRRNGLRPGRPKSRSPHPHGDRCAKEKDRSNLPSFFVHILRSAPDFPARPIRSAPETATSGRSDNERRTRPRGTASRRPSRRKRRPRRSSAAAPAPDSALSLIHISGSAGRRRRTGRSRSARRRGRSGRSSAPQRRTPAPATPPACLLYTSRCV